MTISSLREINKGSTVISGSLPETDFTNLQAPYILLRVTSRGRVLAPPVPTTPVFESFDCPQACETLTGLAVSHLVNYGLVCLLFSHFITKLICCREFSLKDQSPMLCFQVDALT